MLAQSGLRSGCYIFSGSATAEGESAWLVGSHPPAKRLDEIENGCLITCLRRRVLGGNFSCLQAHLSSSSPFQRSLSPPFQAEMRHKAHRAHRTRPRGCLRASLGQTKFYVQRPGTRKVEGRSAVIRCAHYSSTTGHLSGLSRDGDNLQLFFLHATTAQTKMAQPVPAQHQVRIPGAELCKRAPASDEMSIRLNHHFRSAISSHPQIIQFCPTPQQG